MPSATRAQRAEPYRAGIFDQKRNKSATRIGEFWLNRRVDTAGLADLFARMAENMRSLDLRPVREAARTAVTDTAKDCFGRQMSPSGNPWPPRKDVRDRKPLLDDTGRLKAAATGQGAGLSFTVDGRGFRARLDVPYGKHHQDGTRTIPARPFLGVGPLQLVAFQEALATHIANHLLGG